MPEQSEALWKTAAGEEARIKTEQYAAKPIGMVKDIGRHLSEANSKPKWPGHNAARPGDNIHTDKPANCALVRFGLDCLISS